MVSDPLSNFIVGLKNAQAVGKATLVMPASKLKEAVADLLQKEGYIKSVTRRKKTNTLEVTFFELSENKGIKDIKRVSKPSLRVYKGFDELHPFKNGFGSYIISTPKGLLTDRQAIKEKVGGEVLFKIW